MHGHGVRGHGMAGLRVRVQGVHDGFVVDTVAVDNDGNVVHRGGHVLGDSNLIGGTRGGGQIDDI